MKGEYSSQLMSKKNEQSLIGGKQMVNKHETVFEILTHKTRSPE